MGSAVFKTVEGCCKGGPGGFDSHPLPLGVVAGGLGAHMTWTTLRDVAGTA